MVIHNFKCKNSCTLIVVTILLLLSTNRSFAQTVQNYEGTWYNKETKRYISISFDTETDYATINDWIGKNNQQQADAYKAYIKDDKLILYAENSDHHCTYCEMVITNQQLTYQCNENLNFTDQFLNTTQKTKTTLYKRIK